jgi:CxxC-x17-CxxC domain-containing protein
MNSNNGGDREMFQGNWKCSGCGNAITQLPFKPDPAREGGLLCRDCHRNSKGDRPKQDRQMFEGNWKCSRCGGGISQLPFQPDPSRTNTLVCRDCFKK